MNFETAKNIVAVVAPLIAKTDSSGEAKFSPVPFGTYYVMGTTHVSMVCCRCGYYLGGTPTEVARKSGIVENQVVCFPCYVSSASQGNAPDKMLGVRPFMAECNSFSAFALCP